MCKIKGVTLGIKDLNFTSHRGKMAARLTDGREVMRLTFYHIIALVASSVLTGCFCKIPYIDSSDIVKIDSLHSHLVTKRTALLYLNPNGPHAVKATIKSEVPAILQEDRIYVANHNRKYPVKLSAFNGIKFRRQKTVNVDSVANLFARLQGQRRNCQLSDSSLLRNL